MSLKSVIYKNISARGKIIFPMFLFYVHIAGDIASTLIMEYHFLKVSFPYTTASPIKNPWS